MQEPHTVPRAAQPATPAPEPQNIAEVVYTQADFDRAIAPGSETERAIVLSIASWMEMLYLTDGFDDERVKEVMTFFHHPEPGSTFWLHIIDDELLGYPAVFECATRADLQRAVSALEADVSETAESVVLELLFHPGFADETLMRLAQNPRYTTPLGHRSGPQELLEFLADRYAYPEAVTTLALHYYGAPQAGAKPFAAFLERYKGVEMLEYNLLNAQNLDPAKAAIVAKVFPQET